MTTHPTLPPGNDADELVGPDGPVTVRDPYRVLEDPDDPVTQAWSVAQDALVRGYLEGLPGRAHLDRRIRTLLATGLVTPPGWRGARQFVLRREPEQQHPVLLTIDPDGTERVLVDPAALDPSGATTLDAWEPDHEGRRVAYLLSVGGDEESALRVLDVATGEVVDGPIDRTRYSGIGWLPGGEALFLVRRLAPGAVPTGEEQFHRRVWRHRLGTDPKDDVEVHGAGLDPTNYYRVSVSPDGRWLLVSASAGTAPRDDVWIADLTAGPPDAPALRPLQVGTDARLDPWVGPDGRLYLRTDRDAPRGRLCVTDPEDAGYETWTDLVPERPEAVLEHWAVLDDAVVVAHTVHAVAELTLHDRATGELRRAVELPGLGSVTGLTVRPDGGNEAWIGYTDYVTSSRVLHLDARSGTVTPWAEPPGTVLAPAVHVTQESFRSADGTEVRMFVLAPTSTPVRPLPTVLYGYGGFNIMLTPAYSPGILAWVESGGVYAVAGLRGGSEEGEAWHRDGMRAHKQHVFDDLHAAARHLIERGWTAPPKLGISGGSNGGLLVGAGLTQRPDLYAAVVCMAPLLDMVRYERFGLGRTWNDEYGRADEPEELGWLLGYSPYHHVTPGTAYPSVLFTVFDSDTRVDPLHGRKMCAALQAATSRTPREAPVLIRRERDVGHGARSIERTAALTVDTTAFLAERLGLEFPRAL